TYLQLFEAVCQRTRSRAKTNRIYFKKKRMILFKNYETLQSIHLALLISLSRMAILSKRHPSMVTDHRKDPAGAYAIGQSLLAQHPLRVSPWIEHQPHSPFERRI